MSFSHFARAGVDQFAIVITSFLQRDGLPFSKVLPEEHIARVFAEANVTFAQDEVNPVYTPAITLWAFLPQVLFKGEQRSCAAAVSRVIVFPRRSWTQAVLGEHGCLLSRPRQDPDGSGSTVDDRRGGRGGDARARRVALERSARQAGGWLHGQPAGYGSQPGRVSAIPVAAGRRGISTGALCGASVLGHGNGRRSGDRTVRRQRDR